MPEPAADAFTEAFVTGWGLFIAAAVPTLTWAPTGRYSSGQIGIYTMRFPLDVDGLSAVGAAVVLDPYPLADDPAFGESTIGLRVRTRAAGPDVRAAWQIDDAIFNAIAGLYGFTLPTGIPVVTVERSTSTDLGPDDANRARWTSSYPTTVHRPTAHRW